MRDWMDIGPSPVEEDCVQVGTDDYYRLARAECQRFIALIRKHLGAEPDGAQLGIKRNPHDFGEYLEVVCYFDDQNEAAREYALRCESDAPARWDGGDDTP